jgi:hypothetical protein
MKLRFDLDQAACTRAGIQACASPVVIEVDAARIKLEVRNLIADRLIGNDVCQLWNSERGTSKSVDAKGTPVRLVAEAPSFEGLMKAVLKDAQIVQARQSCHRAIALARANTLEETRPIQSSSDTSRFQKTAMGVVITQPVETSGPAPAPAASAPAKKPRKKRIPTRAPRTSKRKTI